MSNPVLAPPGPAHEAPSQIVDFWNTVLAPKFIRFRHVLVDGLSHHSATVLPELQIPEGSRILDVGCGFGDTAIYLANATGKTGEVVGVDCCARFLEHAQQDAHQLGAENVRFIEGDVERGIGEGLFDIVFSRFGTMFFTNPVAGLRSMRACLKPGGQLAHIVWRERKANPWVFAAHDIVRQFLPAPGDNAQSCGPGPFSMADQDTTHAKMEAAGFSDIAFKRIDARVSVGRDVEDAVAFQLAVGPAGETFREAGALAEQRRPEIVAELTRFFEDIMDPDGGLWMDSSSWLITARAPSTQPVIRNDPD